MKTFAVFVTVFGLLLASVWAKSLTKDDCLDCVKDVVDALNYCKVCKFYMNFTEFFIFKIFLKNLEGPVTIDCIEKYLEAAADCIICICDILDIIEGGDGVCDSN